MSKITNLKYKSIRKAIGAELKRVREEKGMSLEQVAEESQVIHPCLIKKWEDGKGWPYSVFNRLIPYYKKQIKIELVD